MTKSRIYPHFKAFPAAQWHWPNFTPKEMRCKGDNSIMIDGVAMDRLQALRDAIGKPFHIHSAYRSPSHNLSVGGAPRSRHMLAEAFDIRMEGHDPREFAAMAEAFGFHGIGRYPESEHPFLHIDIRPQDQEATWGPEFPYGEDDHLAPPPPALPGPVTPARPGLKPWLHRFSRAR